MSIPESQLKTWSNQGSVENSIRTHESVRNALSYYRFPRDYEVYLQGSYKNTTNIRGDSDVDVVAQLSSPDSSYGWRNFYQDVLTALRKYYGYNRVTPSKKCIKVQTSYLPADVVVCEIYRNSKKVEGMRFYVSTECRWIINYPKEHYNNGAAKNQRISQRYKPTIRCFKNERNRLIDKGRIYDDTAPSYFVEGLLYNVPDKCFQNSMSDTYVNVVNYLNKADLNNFFCQNRQDLLFGNTPEQWNRQDACKFINELIYLWNNYPSD